ncbi:hypothetical protein ACLOJK_015195 [Asimina triloba]
MKNGDEEVQQRKPFRSRSRDVSSRFLLSPDSIDTAISSPIHAHAHAHAHAHSPIQHRKKTSALSSDSRRHRSSSSSIIDEAAPTKGLWPSSSSSSKKSSTLADHLGNERLIDSMERKEDGDGSFSRQRSCSSEFSRFDNDNEGSKENHRPTIGGSMRFTGKIKFPGKKSSFSSPTFTPGRLSVDETALDRRRKSDSLFDCPSSESDASAATDAGSASASVGRPRKAGIEVASRFLQDPASRTTTSRKGTSDHSSNYPAPGENSGSWASKNAIRRTASLTAYSSATSQWALSPGRTASPPISAENMGKPVPSFSSLRPPSSPSKPKGVGNLISMGLELFKGKKSSSSSSSSAPLTGSGVSENVHQLRMYHNRMLQWRFANAKAEAIHQRRTSQAEVLVLLLVSSVVQKRVQLEKEKLELKLNRVLNPQIKPLEAWAEIERQHFSAVSMTKDCIHSVVCRVPLIEGAQADSQSLSMALRHAADLTSSINAAICGFSPMGTKTAPLISELAEVVARERSLFEEFFELLEEVANLELQERSLRCQIMQVKTQEQKQQQQQLAQVIN